MRTLVAVSPLPQLYGGEVALLRLAKALRPHGWETVVTVPAGGKLEAAARAAGLATRRLPLGPPDRRTAAAWAGLALAPLALRGADAVLLNGLPAQRVAPALGLIGVPAVLRVNNPLGEPPAAWGRRGFWDRVRLVAADSEHVARECIAAGAPAERVEVAYPAAWSAGRAPRDVRTAEQEIGQRVGFVGRLEPRKGVAELVAAAEAFLAGRPDATLTIVGEPPRSDPGGYAELVRAVAGSSTVAERIRFAGWRDDAAAEMAGFDLLAVPSLEEPFGTVAAEAAAAGTPVVASRIGGLAEVVLDGETGVLVPPGEEAALAQAIGALLDEPARLRALGAHALEQAERFSPEAYATTVAALLDRAGSGPA